MRHIQGEDRHQRTLLPDALEDFVDAENPVRVIDAYINSLDMADLGFNHAVTKETGRKPYDPADLLKLYVYGYLNKVAATRRLEVECHRNLEVIWLMSRLRPDHKTIADFRKDNSKAIRATCSTFIQFCRAANLLSGRLVAIDGSKFKAAASKDQMLTRKQLKRDQRELEQKVQRYLERLDQFDSEEPEIELERSQVESALNRLVDKAQRLEQREKAMDELGCNQHCATEPEARLVRSGRDGMIVGYNVQSAVDADTGLIVHHDVTNETGDSLQLQPMAERAKAELGVEKLEVLADAGYSNGEQQAGCEEMGITATVPRRLETSSYPERYQKSDFVYDKTSNSYRCPAGEVLHYCREDKRRKLYEYRRSGCNQCPLQPNCTTADRRTITRNKYEETFERSEARLQADPTLMTQRMAIAERPFAMLKRAMSLRRFSCHGMTAAKTEISLGILSFNLQRITNRMGVPKMLALIG
jgi:transposase